MATRAIEALSISSANGWWVSSDSGASFSPIACWVLTLAVNDEFKTLAPDKVIVGVDAYELDSLSGLELENRKYYHDTDFKVIGVELY